MDSLTKGGAKKYLTREDEELKIEMRAATGRMSHPEIATVSSSPKKTKRTVIYYYYYRG